MGGLKKGELASATIIRTMSEWFENSLPKIIESGYENEKVKKPQISETDTELIATVETYYGPDLGAHENIRKMEYRFDKVIDDEFLFYRLSGIKEIS